ncbi:radical SAM/SPASM domain-containing protein [Pseudobacteroides cellulosolvens]|uniref:4Fe4S-binding SPASM domain containing protein n=1 Tax=Pseudobacteroides cellulosolvens ATCC 35603 = DSM 2933 TaxID=398512 RepID=A0A0L6JTD3_9FIRM|nr:radical SAM protein [Pseudobacteroides cellulosolvens]KNY28940.1 4Fe4S-binding SPASM domain containing protein [Pseudobacteroides cellulosolvens ATCC 35603 = DSM 2933]
MDNFNVRTINVLDKKFIFFPYSLIFFESNDLIDKLVLLLSKKRSEEFILNSVGEDIESAKIVLNQLNDLMILEEKSKELIKNNKSNNAISKLKLKAAQINTINACNLKCKYCFAKDGSHGENNVLSKHMVKDIIDFLLKEGIGEDELSLTIIGGEPLLNFPVFEEIINCAKAEGKAQGKDIRFITTTNGTLINERIASVLKENNVSTMLSLDSHDKNTQDYLRPSNTGTSSYDMINNSYFKYQCSSKEKSKVHVTITPFNKNIYDIGKNFFEMGFSHVHFEEVISEQDEFKLTKEDVDILKKEYEKLSLYLLEKIKNNQKVSCYPLLDDIKRINERRLKIKKCGVLNNMIGISPDGNLYPCDMLMWGDYKLGSISTGINYDKVNDLIINHDLDLQCNECWARYICGGQCLGERELIKDKEQRSYRCSIKKHIVRLKLYMLSELGGKKEYIDNL